MIWSVVTLVVYFGLWGAVHSFLASLRVKGWAQRTFGPGTDRWYRLAYNAVAAITFLPVVALIPLLPDRPLYVIPSPWRYLTIGLQVLSLAALGWGLWQTGVMHLFGLAQLLATDATGTGSLQASGFYRYTRHPVYLFSLILIWLTPVMTVNVATANLLATLYVYVGIFFEERKLLAEFGEAYAAYQQRVPRLLPRLKLGHSESSRS